MSPARTHLAVALVLLTAAGVTAQPAPTGDAPLAGEQDEIVRRLYVTVVTRNDDGKVYCALWRGREGFPTGRNTNVGEARDTSLRNGLAHCVFEDVSPGEYAVAVFHDENGNDDLDRNFFGIPSEGTGASNDAHNMFGPPSYEDARFFYPDTHEHAIRVRIRY